MEIFPWSLDRAGHGGFSAIAMREGGAEALLLLDTGWVQPVRIDRDATGRIRRIDKREGTRLRPPPGIAGKFDTEGLALDGHGGFHVSTEAPARLWHYGGPATRPDPLPAFAAHADLPENRGLEALARAPDGALWTLPERVEDGTLALAVFRDGAWSNGPRLAASDGFVPVGLDFDDGGRLYLLERQFDLPFRFRSRVRRLTLEGGRVAAEEILLTSRSGQYDNLEGLSVWRDGAGDLRLTLVSDDNFLFVQETQLVELAVPD